MKPQIQLIDLQSGQALPYLPNRKNAAGFTVALGNFDGVHLAHRQLLTMARDTAQQLSEQDLTYLPAAWCFRTPSGVCLGQKQHASLTTLDERLRFFADCGLKYAFIADFWSVRDMAAQDFIRDVLQRLCNVHAVCCGFHFHFGKDGAGNPELLKQAFGSRCRILPPQSLSNQDNDLISSSSIRRYLIDGRCERAACMLGYPYFLQNTVIYGKQLGRTLGIPTANQNFQDEKLIPAHGVYATASYIDGALYYGVSNVGMRPSVGGDNSVNCETHLIDYHGDLYGKSLTVHFLKKLRDERLFPDLDSLKAAIGQDIEATKHYALTQEAKALTKQIPYS